jgi:hypothetical protein
MLYVITEESRSSLIRLDPAKTRDELKRPELARDNWAILSPQDSGSREHYLFFYSRT